MSKPGRNDPCPCGSGKKYKHCCLLALETPSPEEPRWRRVRRALESLAAKLLRFGEERYGSSFFVEAWEDFCVPEEYEDMPQDTPHMQVFMPWLFFHWLPEEEITAVKTTARDGLTLAQAYLRDRRNRIEPILVEYLEACCAAPLSFYDVVSVRPGQGVVVRDIFDGTEIDVSERSGSQFLRAGDICFAKVARLSGLSLFEAFAPAAIPPDRREPILRLRKRIERRNKPVTQAILYEWQYDMLAAYWEIIEPILNPQPPQLQNTDGDPLVMQTLVYDIESPQEAFDALADLCIVGSREGLLEEAQRNAKGELSGICIDWHKPGNAQHKSWTNTVMGKIEIEGRRLKVEVNSENRALTFRKLMDERLPKARYQTTVTQSVEAMLAERNTRPPTAAERKAAEEQKALMARPEVQAALAEQMNKYYEQWLDTEIPALHGKTPRQAVKSRDGRELVEGLLLKMERHGADNPGFSSVPVENLRQALGLSRAR